jgi:hypothetical protein
MQTTNFKIIIRIIKSRRMRWAGHVARWVGEEEYRLLVGEPEGRPRRRWVANIRMDLLDLGCDDVDLIGLVQDRNRWKQLESSCEFGIEPSSSIKCWEVITILGLSSGAQLHIVSFI